MSKNITLRLNEALLNRCRLIAVQENKSVSQWMTALLIQVLSERDQFMRSRKKALKRLEKGLQLGGKPLSREEIYAERT